MNFERQSGNASILPYKKTASTAFSLGSLVTQTAGLLSAVAATTVPGAILGVLLRNVVSTDSDFASTDECMVEVPETATVYKAKVGAGVPAQSMVGSRYDLTATGDVNLGAQLVGVVQVVRLSQDASYIYVKFVIA